MTSGRESKRGVPGAMLESSWKYVSMRNDGRSRSVLAVRFNEHVTRFSNSLDAKNVEAYHGVLSEVSLFLTIIWCSWRA